MWCAFGSAALGLGIWCMHYIAMLAFHLPMVVGYDPALVALSLLASVFASAIALGTVSGKTMNASRAVSAAVVMGCGIATMHYVGMSAMRMNALAHYETGKVALSIIVAFVVSLAALVLAFRFRRESSRITLPKVASAGLMGTAIAAMHYTGMAAVHFHSSATTTIPGNAFNISELGAFGIGLTTLLVLGGGMLTALVDKRLSTQAQALEASEIRYRTLFERIPIGMYRSTLRGEIIEVNDAFLRLLGHANLEDCKRRGAESMYFDTQERRKFIDGLLSQKSVTDLELKLRRRGGEPVWVLANAFLNDVDQRDATLIEGSIIDNTERKQAKQKLEKAKKAAEAASQAKSEFLATMSHEIRTPMNGIMGITEIMLESEQSTEQHENLSMIKQSAVGLLAIINDILDFSKIEAGKMELECVPFQLRETLDGITKSLGFRAAEKGLDLVYYVDEDVPDALVGDPGRVRQILINLIGNAIKFTERGEVAVQVEHKAGSADGAQLQFEIRDTGIGMPVEAHERIFESFSQVDGSTTRRFGGTGLGLVITRKLVEKMGGRIWVESQLDRGSTFFFTAQFAVDHAPRKKFFSADTGKLKEKTDIRILLAEDNKINQAVAKKLLQKRGAVVTIVENGQEAVAAVQQQDFDVVLMDIEMPVLDGLSAARQIRHAEENTGRHVPIIALTAHAIKGDEERFLAAGMDAYLSKPFNIEALFDVIGQAQSDPRGAQVAHFRGAAESNHEGENLVT